jgi:hypothetical protein
MPSGLRASRRSPGSPSATFAGRRRPRPEYRTHRAGLRRCACRRQRIEVGDSVDTQDHGFAVEHETPLADFLGRLDDPRVSSGPVVAASGNQPHEVAAALDPKPVAVIFDFVKLVRGVGDAG